MMIFNLEYVFMWALAWTLLIAFCILAIPQLFYPLFCRLWHRKKIALIRHILETNFTEEERISKISQYSKVLVKLAYKKAIIKNEVKKDEQVSETTRTTTTADVPRRTDATNSTRSRKPSKQWGIPTKFAKSNSKTNTKFN